MEFLAQSLLELITQTSTNLPPDVRAAMSLTSASETPGTQSAQALNIILSNIDMATDDEGPICQDTGMPTFVVHTPVGVNQLEIKRAIRTAVAEATRRGKLRPNSVDSLTGKNSGDNLGEETPVMHFEQWEQDEIEVKLILKGRRLREQEYPVFAALRTWTTWVARIAIWKECASACCTRCGRRRGKVARRERWACASAATARTATNWRRGSCSARWTM